MGSPVQWESAGQAACKAGLKLLPWVHSLWVTLSGEGKLPLGRLFSRVRHPGAAGACERRELGTGLTTR